MFPRKAITKWRAVVGINITPVNTILPSMKEASYENIFELNKLIGYIQMAIAIQNKRYIKFR